MVSRKKAYRMAKKLYKSGYSFIINYAISDGQIVGALKDRPFVIGNIITTGVEIRRGICGDISEQEIFSAIDNMINLREEIDPKGIEFYK